MHAVSILLKLKKNKLFLNEMLPFKNMSQTHKRFRRTLFIRTKTQSADFQGNPLCQATK